MFSFRSWLRSLARQLNLRRGDRPRRKRIRPSPPPARKPPLRVEELEPYFLLSATLTWQGGNNTFNTANWTDGTNSNLTPTAGDNYVINSGVVTVANSQTVGSLTINGTNNRLVIDSGFSVSASGTVAVEGGADLTNQGTLSTGALSVDAGSSLEDVGGSLTVNAASTVSGSFTQQVGGTITANAALTLAGTTTLTAGSVGAPAITDTNVINTGTLNLDSTFTLYSGLSNQGTINQTGGSLDLVYNNTVLLTNASTGTYNIQETNNAQTVFSGNGGIFLNQGLLETNAGGIVVADDVTNNGGTIQAGTGDTLELFSANYEDGGTFKVSGGSVIDLTVGSSSSTITGTSTITSTDGTGTVQLDGSYLTVGAGGATLNSTTQGILQWNSGTITGNTSPKPTLTIGAGSYFTLGGNVTLSGANLDNLGTIDQTLGQLDIESGNTFTNAGTYYLEQTGTPTVTATVRAGTLDNQGTLVKTAGTGSNTIQLTSTLTNEGTIDVLAGELDVANATYNDGTALQVDNGAILNLTTGSGANYLNGTVTATLGTNTGTGSMTLGAGRLYVGAGGATLDATPGLLQMNGTTLAGTGTLTIDHGYGVTVSGTSYVDTNLVNHGTISQTGGQIQLVNGTPGSTLTNATDGTYSISTTGNNGTLTQYGRVDNQGTLSYSGSGTATLNSDLLDEGTIDASAGQLNLYSATFQGGGSFNVSNGAIVDLTGGGSSTISGTWTVTLGINSGIVQMTGGILNVGTAGATFDAPAGHLLFTGGFIDDANNSTASLIVGAGYYLTLAGSFSLGSNANGMIVNDGTIIQTGGQFTSGTLVNAAGATFDAEGGTSGAGSNAILLNEGRLLDFQTTPVTVDNVTTAGGSIVALAGTLQLHSATLDDGTTLVVSNGATIDLTDNGQSSIGGTVTVTRSGPFGQVVMGNGDLNILPGGATLVSTTQDVLQWTGGTLEGENAPTIQTLTLAQGSYLSVRAGSGTVTLRGNLDNQGTIDQYSGKVQAYYTLTNDTTGIYNNDGEVGNIFTGGTFVNKGLLTSSNVASITPTTGLDEGLVHVLGSELLLGNMAYSGGGTLEVDAGAILNLTDNTTGSITGTWTLSGGGTVQLGGGTLAIGTAGATLRADPSNPAVFEWTGGTLSNYSSQLTIGTGTEMDIAGTVALQPTLLNQGTIEQTLGTLSMSGGSTLINQGSYNIQDTGTLDQSGTILNQGALNYSASGTATLYGLRDEGTITASAGQLNLFAATFQGGGSFLVSGGGIVDLTGGYSSTMSGTWTASGTGGGSVQMSSGILSIASAGATLDAAQGVLKFTGGSLSDASGSTAALTIAAGSYLTVAGNIALYSSPNAILVNDGTITQSAGGIEFTNSNVVQLINQADGVYNVTETGLFLNHTGVLLNKGILNAAGGGAMSSDSTLSNPGTVNVISSSLGAPSALTIPYADYANVSGNTLTQGIWHVAAGSSLTDGPSAITSIGAGAAVILDGAGSDFTNLDQSGNSSTLAVTTTSGSLTATGGRSFSLPANFTNNGTLTAGTGSTITVSGNYVQATTGTLSVQVGGSPSSGEYGQLDVNGSASLSGTLNATLVNGYFPEVGQNYQIVTAGGITGGFTKQTGALAGSPGQNQVFTSATGSTSVTLATGVSVVPSIQGPSVVTAGIPTALTSNLGDTQTGQTYTYAWAVTGPAGFTLPATVITDEPALVFTPPQSGTYTVSLTVTSFQGVSGTTSFTMTAGTPGPAIVLQGAPPSGAVGTAVNLTSNVLEPAGATPSSYTWSVTLNGQAYTLPTGTVTNAANFSFTPTAAGLYTVNLGITDSLGGASTQSVSFLVGGPPTASVLGASADVPVGMPLTLTNAVTSPNLNGPLTYSWAVTGPGGSQAQVNTTGVFTFTPTLAGAYQITLTVSDSQGDIAVASPVNVQAISTSVPVVITGAPFRGSVTLAGNTVTLGSQVAEPAGVAITSYAWSASLNGSPYTLPAGTTTNAATFSFKPTAPGLYTVTLATLDSAGDAGLQSTTFLVVAPPVASIFGAPSSAPVGMPLTLTNNPGSPTLGLPLTYTWTAKLNGNNYAFPSGTATNASALSFTPTQAGTYQFNLSVSNGYYTTNATPVTVQVVNAPLPVAITGTPPFVASGSSVTLGSQVTEPAGVTPSTYAWSVSLNGTPYALPSTIATNASTFTFTPTTPGLYVVNLTATDSAGDKGIATAVLPAASANGLALNASGPFAENTQSQVSASLANPAPGVTYTFAWTVSGLSTLYSASGPGTASPQGTVGSSFSFTPPAPGTYQVNVTATGSDGSIATTSQLFQVAAIPPLVTFTNLPTGPLYEGTSVNVGTVINQPGTTSGNYLYQWTVTGPGNTTFTSAASNFAFTPSLAGSYSVVLTVTDSNGTSTTNTAVLNVLQPPPPIPVIQSASATGVSGTTLILNLAAQEPTPGPDVTYAYVWTLTDNGNQVATATGPTFSYTGSLTSTDNYAVKVMVSDAAGSATASLPIFFAAPNTTLTLTSSNVPAGATQVLAFALGSATIDGTGLSISQVQTALGGNDTLLGGAGSNVLQGDSGSNSLVGGTGNDTLYATANDTLIGGTGTGTNLFQILPGPGEVVQAGTTANTLSFAQATAGVSVDLTQYTGQTQTVSSGSTLALTGSIQSLVGSSGSDTLTAGNNSTVFGGGGDDTLVASGSNLALVAGNPIQLPTGTSAAGIAQFGGLGNDSLYASGGSSVTMIGGAGNSTLSATGGSSSLLIGGSGNSTLLVTGGSSITMFGGTGNDSLYSSGGSSITILGGTGNDTLTTTSGTSVSMTGGSGNATLTSSGGSSITMFGGTGNDSLYSSGGTSVSMTGSVGNDSLVGTGGSSITLTSGSGNATLVSSGGTSITMFGGTGNDSLYSSGGSSVTMMGGTGNDTLSTTGGSTVSMTGGSGNATLTSSGGSSITMFGGTGNDSLYSSGGTSVSMAGGMGNDSLSTTSGSSVSMTGGSGNATLASSGGSSITMFGGTGNDSLYSSGGTSVLMIGSVGNDTLAGTGGSSITLIGSTGNATLVSSGGSSITMFGGTGNDSLYSSGGSSITMIGGSANDTLSSTSGTSVSMTGGSGNSTLTSSGGSSITMLGGTGNDSLYTSGGSSVSMTGGSGNSTLASSGGSSITMFGGTGNDSLYSSGGSSVTIVGGSGNDTLSTTVGSTILMTGGSGNATLASSGGSSITMFGGTGNDSLYSSGGSSITMIGGSANDTLSSTGGSSTTLIGGSGNSTLVSTGGSSITMFGGTGNDSLYSSGGSSASMVGGTGNDTLTSTNGSSVTMLGGSGNSTLASSGGSSITMFGGTGNDSLYSSGGTSVSMTGGGGNDSLGSTGGSSITLIGGTGNATLASSGGSSITMFGGTGNDSLYSSGGSSITILGGTGNDTLTATSGTSVSMTGGSGNATLASSGGSSITMFGGTGNDSLYSSGGSSVSMTGGTGNDSLNSSSGSSVTMIGGSGSDSLTSTGGSSVTMIGGSGNSTLASSGGSSITMFGGTGNDSLYSSGGSSITVVGGTGNDTLTTTSGTSVLLNGGSGNATLASSGGSSITMFGGTGNDSLYSSGGSSVTMLGGSGNDTLSNTSGSGATLAGGSGNSTLVSTGGSSITMFGGTGNDSLYSSGGSSVLMVGGSGNDTLGNTGGSGNSTLTPSGGSSITMFGGSGNDSLYSSGGTSVTMLGGTGNDTLSSTSGSSVSMLGGSGNSTLVSSGGSSITMFGGTGNDSLYSSGGSGVSMLGGTGNDTLSSTGGTSATLVGGTGNSTLASSGGSSVTLYGGTGNDSLTSTGGSSVSLIGGSGNSTLVGSGGSSITMFGGSGNDSLASSANTVAILVGGLGTDQLTSAGDQVLTAVNGASANDLLSVRGGTSVSLIGGSGNDTLAANGGTAIGLYGLDGNNTYEVTGSAADPLSASLNDLATFGQQQPQTDAQTNAVNTLLFPAVSSGITLDLSNTSTGTAATAFVTSATTQQVTTGLSLFLTGQFQNVVGTESGNDYIHGDASSNVLQAGAGNDTLLGGAGPATLVAGSGNDSLVAGSGGTTFQFAGTNFGNDTIDPPNAGANALDFSRFGGPVTLNLGSTATQTVSPASKLALTLQSAAAINAVVDSAFDDAITGNALNDSFYAGSGNDTFTGGGGNDAYFFSGGQLGSDTITETTTNNTLNFLGLNAGVNLNLNQAGTQTLNSSLTLNLSNPAAFSTVVGTPFSDTIIANNGNDTLFGAGGDDSLVAGSGNDYLQGYISQVVYLDFTEPAPAGDIVYSTDEINQIVTALQADYADFNYTFTTDPQKAAELARTTGGQFVTMEFNQGQAGGASDQLDVDHRVLSGVSKININPFLGTGTNQLPNNTPDVINLTADIAAHELGHLSGLQHQDAFGPIGSGIYSGVYPDSFYPIYTGPTGATQTPFDIMASPASVNSPLADAASGTTSFGARDAIKLAFDDTGTILQQQNLTTQAVNVSGTLPSTAVLPPGTPTPAPFTITQAYALPALPSLAVPNPLPSGASGSGQTFDVTALAVNATLSTATQQDFYAFQGQAGELMNFQVISNNNTLNPHPILPELLLVGPTGQVLGYNVHEFESPDSSLYDITLPTTGTYYVGVDSLLGLTAGNYQLFLYSFATNPSSVPSTGGGDTLVGGNGNDTLVGSSGNDQFLFPTGSTGNATLQGGSGQDVANLIGSPAEQVTAFGNVAVQQPAPTTTTLTSNVSGVAASGQAVTFTATVAPVSGQGTPTGTVTFMDGSTPIGTGTLAVNSAGADVATFTTSALPQGSDSITAVYQGDSNFDGSPSAALTQVVGQFSTTTGLASSVSPSVYGQSVTFTATVIATSSTGDTPSGTVTFYDGSNQIGTGTLALSNGADVATFATSVLSVASHAISAVYGGDSTFSGSTSATLNQVVAQDTTTTLNASSPNPSASGQVVTFTATVSADSPGSGAPTGAVTFEEGSTVLGTATLSASGGTGTATFSTPALGVATHSITAVYGGDTSFYGSTSAALSQVVNQDPTTTTLTSSLTPSVYGGLVTFAATVSANAPGSGTPSGTVTFYDGSTQLGTATLSASGGTDSATFSTSTLSAGALALSAVYNGDADFAGSQGDLTQNVQQATPAVNVVDAGGTYSGQPFPAITATVAGVVPGVDTMPASSLEGTGLTLDYVQLNADGTVTDLGNAAPIDAGNYQVTASFAGSTDYSSASASTPFTIRQAQTAVNVLDNGDVYNGSAFVATGSVADTSNHVGLGSPSFTYYAGTYSSVSDLQTAIGSGLTALGGAPVNAGSYTVFASYGGDVNHTASAAAADFTISPATVTGFITAQGKVYDGTTAVTLTSEMLRGVLGSDPVSLTVGAASFDSALAGLEGVTATGLGLTGSAAGNYQLASTTATTTATISQASAIISIQGVSVTYDGNAHAATGTATGVESPTPADLSSELHLSYSSDGGQTFSSSAPVNAGSYEVYYTFDGDTNYQAITARTDSGQAVDIAQAAATTTGSVSAPQDFGQRITFTAVISSDPSGTPTGSVDFYDTTTLTNLGTVVLSGGTASLTTTALPVGMQTITISYSGDKNFLPSTGSVTVSPATSIYVLNSSAAGALDVSGNASLSVPGIIVVDSTSTSAVKVSGNATVSASSIRIAGGDSGSASGSFSITPATGVPAESDPLAGLAAPTVSGTPVSFNLGGNTSQTINPGVYSQIKVSGSASLTMNPGVYVLAGGNFSVSGNASVKGSGVTIYMACSDYTSGTIGGTIGGVSLSGNGTIDLRAPTTGTYAGILIYQPSYNTRALNLSGNGYAGLNNGAIYAPSALLNVGGNAEILQSPIVANELKLTGNTSSTLTADTAGGTNNTAGQLLAGDLFVYADNSSGYFTSDELTSIQNVITATDSLVEPYGVSVTEVNDPSLANIVISAGTTSPVGGAADGVLGCYTINTGQITILEGWDWYAGTDPTAIGANQYSFTTTVTHEIGHALGLGGSDDTSSPMYETVSAGVVRGGLTTQDLNLEGLMDESSDALRAALPPAPVLPAAPPLATPAPETATPTASNAPAAMASTTATSVAPTVAIPTAGLAIQPPPALFGLLTTSATAAPAVGTPLAFTAAASQGSTGSASGSTATYLPPAASRALDSLLTQWGSGTNAGSYGAYPALRDGLDLPASDRLWDGRGPEDSGEGRRDLELFGSFEHAEDRGQRIRDAVIPTDAGAVDILLQQLTSAPVLTPRTARTEDVGPAADGSEGRGLLSLLWFLPLPQVAALGRGNPLQEADETRRRRVGLRRPPEEIV